MRARVAAGCEWQNLKIVKSVPAGKLKINSRSLTLDSHPLHSLPPPPPAPTNPFLPISDESTHLSRIADTLQLFEPYINRLIHIYPLTNSQPIRRSILSIIGTLTSNSVKYEAMDPGRRFLSRALARLERLQTEDVGLLPALFSFLTALSRAGVVGPEFGDTVVGKYLGGVYTRLDEQNVHSVVEATRLVLMEDLRLAVEKQWKRDCRVKELLVREFAFLFTQLRPKTAYLWILLLRTASSAKKGAAVYWTQASTDFLIAFTSLHHSKSVAKSPTTMCSQSSDSRGASEEPTDHSYHLVCLLLDSCSPEAYIELDHQLWECVLSVVREVEMRQGHSTLPGPHPQRIQEEIGVIERVIPFVHLLAGNKLNGSGEGRRDLSELGRYY